MPVPVQRDAELTRKALEEWFGRRHQGRGPVAITGLRVPAESGFANETLMFSLVADGRRRDLVVRAAPSPYRLYPDERLREQCDLMRALGEGTDVPVPEIVGYESDPAILGAPFFVMSAVPGAVPADFPSYHRAGWVGALPPERRAGIWWSALETMARIHRIDVSSGFDYLDQPRYGPTGIGQQLGHYRTHLSFYGPHDRALTGRVADWLDVNRPAEPHPPRLLWGDARLGNLIFAGDGSVAAVLDWEMATLGQPEVDLGWFLYLDRNLSEGIGVPRLAGLPGRQDTIARHEELCGRAMHAMDYYEVLAGYRFCLVTARVHALVERFGMVAPGTEFPLHRNATRLLARTFEQLAS
jgi:aminoglycoside phosphotransferase (APT) family kinase protein